MKTLSTIFGIMVLIFSSVAATEEGCKYDTQCKGERICVKGECVDQPSKSNGLGSPNNSPLPSPDQSSTKPTESQGEIKTEKPVFVGDWHVAIKDAKITKGNDARSKYVYFEYGRRDELRTPNYPEDWRITSSDDSLIIEATTNPGGYSDKIETKLKNVKHKNDLLTFTEEIKTNRGKEIIQYYLKLVNEDKIEGKWKSQGYYEDKEWEIDGDLVMHRMHLPSPSPKPLLQIPEDSPSDVPSIREPKQPGTTLHQEKEKPREELRQNQPQSPQSIP